MHTKWVLLAIVLLNIVDCVLVMGELILDIYYLKGSFKQFYVLTATCEFYMVYRKQFIGGGGGTGGITGNQMTRQFRWDK